jgi:hypothetical protein
LRMAAANARHVVAALLGSEDIGQGNMMSLP